MIKTAAITVYDIVGYLLPGLPLLAAVAVHAAVGRGAPSAWHVIWLILCSYFAGHFAQALGNFLDRWLGLTAGAVDAIPASDRGRVRQLIRNRMNLTFVDDKHLSSVCDHILLHEGNTDTREVYVYREGFYRGMTISTGLFAISNVVAFFGPTPTFGDAYQISPLLVGVISAGASMVWFMRYKRFLNYRVAAAFYGALVLLSATAGPISGPSESAAEGSSSS